MYWFTYDRKIIQSFFERVFPTLEPHEAVTITTAARKKYMTEPQKEALRASHGNGKECTMESRTFWGTPEELTTKVVQYMKTLYTFIEEDILTGGDVWCHPEYGEHPIGYPVEALRVYVGTNPASMVAAYLQFQKEMLRHTENLLLLDDVKDTKPFRSLESKLRTCIHSPASRSRRVLMDIDIDLHDPEQASEATPVVTSYFSSSAKAIYRTTSGFHVLMELPIEDPRITNHPSGEGMKGFLREFEELMEKNGSLTKEVTFVTSGMMPLPGVSAIPLFYN